MQKEENVYGKDKGTEETASAEEQKEEASTVLGKFKDVNALARAYGALEAEFTRRSQRLKELERLTENSVSDLRGAEDSGVEKLRKSAEARRAATKAFDEFVAEVGKAHTEEGAKGTEPDGGKDLPSETEGAKTAEEAGTAKPKESLSETGGGAEEIPSAAEGFGKAELRGGAAFAPVAKSGDATALSEELYKRVCLDEGVRLRIIGEYLSSLGKEAAPITTGRAGTLATPPLKARSIGDAGVMALRYFQKPLGGE